jgi:hypothetical protein
VSEPSGPTDAWFALQHFRAEPLGFRAVTYRTVSTVLTTSLTPDRSLLWLGVLFVLLVYYFLMGRWGGCKLG